MVGLLNRPEGVPPIPLNSLPITGPVFDEELLRWIAEAEYLGVSRETAILIATKRRALNLRKTGGDLVGVQECGPSAPAGSPPSEKNMCQLEQPADQIKPEPEICINEYSGVVSIPDQSNGPSSEDCPLEGGHMGLELLADQQQKPLGVGPRNSSSQTSSTQETTANKFYGLLDQVINTTIAHINLEEQKRRKKRNKRRKRFPQKNSSSQNDNIPNSTSSQSINAQLLKTIVEKDSSSKIALSDDNNSSVDTTMGVVNSGTNQVDRPPAHLSGLDAMVAAHNNPFNNGRTCNIKVRRKKRFCPRNNSNASSSSNRQNPVQNAQVSSVSNDFSEPSRINPKRAKRSLNRNRKHSGLNQNPEKAAENNQAVTPANVEPRNPNQQPKSHAGNGRRTNHPERGRIRPRRSEAVEHVREQLRIAFRSRGVLEV
ncbi:putative secreted protein [Cryptosporidium canis]|uniref:Secreted protein n=1 Tax=Cryptosporidium canis TaxID=195482 RepID=A0A9D5DKT9_9CRYT|nr:putative secreted protein [Cryptosporidium canis]